MSERSVRLRNRCPFRSVLVALLFMATFSTQVIAATYYYVGKRDTLWTISQKYGISVTEIQVANNLRTTTVYRGQRLLIPDPEPKAGTWRYTVKSGDTMYLLAQRYGTTVNTLRSLNNLASDSLWVGQALLIPNSTGGGSSENSWTYTVRTGDTLYLISQRYGTTVNALRSLNNIWTDNLTVGQRLLIPGATPASSGAYTAAERDLLARLVSAEALGEPYDGLVAVAAVVLHRVADPRYPNSIHDVIYQVVNTYYYQFSPVMDGRINQTAAVLAVQAVQDAIAGRDPSNGALGFYNPAKTTNQWVSSQTITARIGDHVFFVH